MKQYMVSKNGRVCWENADTQGDSRPVSNLISVAIQIVLTKIVSWQLNIFVYAFENFDIYLPT